MSVPKACHIWKADAAVIVHIKYERDNVDRLFASSVGRRTRKAVTAFENRSLGPDFRRASANSLGDEAGMWTIQAIPADPVTHEYRGGAH